MTKLEIPQYLRVKNFIGTFRAITLIIALLVSSTAHATYADYSFKEQGPFYNFDMYVTWEHDVPSSEGVYPAFNFAFQNGRGGYMGTQSDSNGKHALFSIWDDVSGSLSATGAHPNCHRFGGEGEGAQCFIEYPWIAGREYRLRIWTLNADSNAEYWGAWIMDTVTQIDTNIGIISLRNSNGYQGYGRLAGSAVFLERYASGYFGVCNSQPASKVRWRGPYANANGATANKAVISYAHYPTSCSNANVWSTGYPNISMEDGGETQRTTPEYTDVWALPLYVSVWGTGNGTVNSIPSGIACDNTCSNNFTRDSSLTLIATSDASSIFNGWSGACSGTGNCVLTMSSDLGVTAQFTEADKVRIGMVPYSTLTEAFTTVTYEQIKVRAIEFTETITIQSPTMFSGGWNAEFTSNSGNFTTLIGTLTIGLGTFTVEGLIIR